MNKWRKSIASWHIGDTLYLSVVFSWDVAAAVERAKQHKGRVVVGGPAAIIQREAFEGVADVQEKCDVAEPILFHNHLATFTTRGCVNACPFCIVPRIESEFIEIRNFRPAPVVCDNNFLAASAAHQERVVDALKRYPLVDFNQGLDCRLFTPDAASNLGRLRLRARFSFDAVSEESALVDAVRLCQERSTKNIGVYVLFGYNDTPDDAIYRLELVRGLGLWPNAMRYQPIDARAKNEYVAPNWTERELRRVARYYNRLRWLEHVSFDEYGAERAQMKLF